MPQALNSISSLTFALHSFFVLITLHSDLFLAAHHNLRHFLAAPLRRQTFALHESILSFRITSPSFNNYFHSSPRLFIEQKFAEPRIECQALI